jgi:hypothetical protein
VSTFDAHGQLDPARGVIVSCFGKKHSGKSIMALLIAQSYPYDIAVLDIAGDDGPMPRKPGEGTHDVVEIRGDAETLPRKWPEHLRHEQRPMIVRYVPDPGSATLLEDLDQVVGLAYNHSGNPRPAMLLVHEVGVLAPANRTPPHVRRVLMHNRHRSLTVAFCGPRPMDIDPLVVSQADLVYTFELNNPADRRRIAENIGWNPREFDTAVHDLGPHEYLLYDHNIPKPPLGTRPEDDDRLVHRDALPADVVADVQRWQRGQPARQDTAGDLLPQR